MRWPISRWASSYWAYERSIKLPPQSGWSSFLHKRVPEIKHLCLGECQDAGENALFQQVLRRINRLSNLPITRASVSAWQRETSGRDGRIGRRKLMF
jgi:hypothetical protein